MRRLFAALGFLTRLPVAGAEAFDAADVGRATLWFPLVGGFVGALAMLARHALEPRFPPLVTAVLICALSAIVTGALHLDGLADTVDGFFGGRTREDALRIMRDHAVGAFGAVALIFVVALKIAALHTLLSSPRSALTVDRWLIAAAALARFMPVALGRFLPYARAGGGLGASVTDHVGWLELGGAALCAGAIAGALLGVDGAIAGGAIVALTLAVGAVAHRKIGGVTGDVMGAAVELGEALVYLLAVGLAR